MLNDTEQIEIWRQKTIQKALEPAVKFFGECQSPSGVCSGSVQQELTVACNGIMLGTFLRSASAHNIWPIPSYPYRGLRVWEVTRRIRALEIKSMCSNNFLYITRAVDTSKSHGYNELFDDEMSKIEGTLLGLDLNWFLSQSK